MEKLHVIFKQVSTYRKYWKNTYFANLFSESEFITKYVPSEGRTDLS